MTKRTTSRLHVEQASPSSSPRRLWAAPRVSLRRVAVRPFFLFIHFDRRGLFEYGASVWAAMHTEARIPS